MPSSYRAEQTLATSPPDTATMVADTIIFAVGMFRIDWCRLAVLRSRSHCPCRIAEQHVVRIGRAGDVVAEHQRVPSSAVWAAELVAGCERRWWCYSSEA
jgi:hypothetical protein